MSTYLPCSGASCPQCTPARGFSVLAKLCATPAHLESAPTRSRSVECTRLLLKNSKPPMPPFTNAPLGPRGCGCLPAGRKVCTSDRDPEMPLCSKSFCNPERRRRAAWLGLVLGRAVLRPWPRTSHQDHCSPQPSFTHMSDIAIDMSTMTPRLRAPPASEACPRRSSPPASIFHRGTEEQR